MKWWVLGKTGQVGSALIKFLEAREPGSTLALGREQLDLSRPTEIRSVLDRMLSESRPHGIFLAAAYTAVDRAESEPDLARAINALSPGHIAQACQAHDIPLVSYSTDYVFPGTHPEGPRGMWKEDDATGPVNVYGVSKLEGEHQVAQADKHLTFRISWVYDAYGKNFFRTMLRLGAEREALSVVSDQWGSPTDARFVAEMSARVLDAELSRATFRPATLHLTRQGSTTWFHFAQAIFARAKAQARTMPVSLIIKQLKAISTEAYPTPARRPLHSKLDTSKIVDLYPELRMWMQSTWEFGLDQCFQDFISLHSPTA